MVGEHSISASFFYWSTDLQKSITITSDTGFNRTFNSRDVYEDTSFPSVPICSRHIYTITSKPIANWFLLVSSKSMFESDFLIETIDGKPFEIINYDYVNLRLKILNIPPNFNLNNVQNCLSAELIWETPDDSSAVLILTPCINTRELCYQTPNTQPFFQSMKPGDANIKVRIKSEGALVWESAPVKLPVHFVAKYDDKNSTSPEFSDNYLKKDFIFNNVLDTSQVNIYLISSSGDLDDKSCPNLTHKINNLPARKLETYTSEICNFGKLSDTPGGNKACISYSSLPSLTQIYTLNIFERITKKDCQYDRLLFEWLADKYVKDSIWQCDFLQDKDCILEAIKPIITPYP